MKKLIILFIFILSIATFAQSYIVLDVANKKTMINEQIVQSDSLDEALIFDAGNDCNRLQYIIYNSENDLLIYEHFNGASSGAKDKYTGGTIPAYFREYLKNKGL